MKIFSGTAVAAIMIAGGAFAAPWPQAEPNTDYQPAFAGQTRAEAMNSGVELNVEPVVEGLAHPWAVELLPEGGALITERPGRLKYYDNTGTINDVSGIPEVSAGGQGGLLDVALSPDFAENRVIFLSYAEPRQGGNGTAVARMVLAEDGASVSDVQVIFRQTPTYDGDKHFGSRIIPAPDGTLFITLGERSDVPIRDTAQDMQNHLGKLIRITPEGNIPSDNPFANGEAALPEIYASGLRNVQAATLDGNGELWTIEHGPLGGDEINKPESGRNYGWPVIAYGHNYDGSPVNEGISAREGMEQPIYYWDPVIAPSGADFYDGNLFNGWQGDLLVGAMNPPSLVRLSVDGERVTGEERFDLGVGRVRDVKVAEDGTIWIVTDENRGGLYRLTPQG
ncbi:PQQ-dependent sugar dehydrogenase [Paracoccus aerodenitrificans]|uniref:PQQ-dependent sugar dehydrogenase n=1 Tax=Paracoccus aerodenitrificans TaxID=3017781 RepID=UPI0022F0D53C|nr:PQQ-dependent sugar dehydrogenase [Paracoccus aerodenitrificans]WBU62925.1 PQQ-dependent sugar dehydrogenase [Paracoccus aerodenitrificans]